MLWRHGPIRTNLEGFLTRHIRVLAVQGIAITFFARYRGHASSIGRCHSFCQGFASLQDVGFSWSAEKPTRSPQTGVHTQSEFNRRASHIGLGIHHTFQKLAKLALLAKRKCVFDDPAFEIQELTALIRQDIQLSMQQLLNCSSSVMVKVRV